MELRQASAGLFALWFCAAGRAHAMTSRGPVLDWRDDGGCSAPPDVDVQLERLPGARRERTPPLRAEVRGNAEAGFRLRFVAGEESDERVRTLELASCEAVREAAILLAAIALDPNAEGRDPASGIQAHAHSSAASSRGAAGVRWGIGADGGVELLTLPGVAPLLGIHGQLRGGAARIGVSARYLGATITGGALPAGVEARLTLLSAAPRVCVMLLESALGLGVCAEAELGRLSGDARNVERGASQHALWLAVSGLALLEYNLSRNFGLQLAAQAGAALRPARFALEQQAPFYAVPATSVRLALGATLWL